MEQKQNLFPETLQGCTASPAVWDYIRELTEQVAALTKENERLTDKLKFADKNIDLLRGHRDELTEQVEKLKKEKQDLQLAFNIMNDPGKELSRLREREKELVEALKDTTYLSECYLTYAYDQKHAHLVIGKAKSLLDKFNDSKT